MSGTCQPEAACQDISVHFLGSPVKSFLKQRKLTTIERASAQLFRSDLETIDRAIEGPRQPTFL